MSLKFDRSDLGGLQNVCAILEQMPEWKFKSTKELLATAEGIEWCFLFYARAKNHVSKRIQTPPTMPVEQPEQPAQEVEKAQE